jgi:NAD(P)-dependent dehydrogenase (short-subunit alcohol dehydrogenase family)
MSDGSGPVALVIGGGSGVGAALADTYRRAGITTVTWDIEGPHDVTCDITEPDASMMRWG